MSKKFLFLAAASILAVTPAMARNGQPTFAPWGVDLTAMDSSVKPGDNFFQYVNGSWAKRTEIAPDRTFVGIDSVLNDQLDKDVRAIVEDMAKDSASSGRIESLQTSSLHLDILRDLKRINSHLAIVAQPLLEAAGELSPTRLK